MAKKIASTTPIAPTTTQDQAKAILAALPEYIYKTGPKAGTPGSDWNKAEAASSTEFGIYATLRLLDRLADLGEEVGRYDSNASISGQDVESAVAAITTILEQLVADHGKGVQKVRATRGGGRTKLDVGTSVVPSKLGKEAGITGGKVTAILADGKLVKIDSTEYPIARNWVVIG